MVVIIENLSGITAESLMSGPAIILVRTKIIGVQTIGQELGVVAGERCSFVAEQWHGMVVALGSIPGGFTFLSCFFAISEIFGCNGMIQRF